MNNVKNITTAATQQQIYLDKAGAAARLGVSVRTVECWVKKRILPALKIGRTVRFYPDDLDATIRKRCRVN